MFKVERVNAGPPPKVTSKPISRWSGFYNLVKVGVRVLFAKKPLHTIYVAAGNVEPQNDPPALSIEIIGFRAGNPYKLLAVHQGGLRDHIEDMKNAGLHVCEDGECLGSMLGVKTGTPKVFAVGSLPDNMPPEVKEAIESLIGKITGEDNGPTKH